MATRLRSRNEPSRWSGSTVRGAWDDTGGLVTRRMHTRKAGSGVATVTRAISVTTADYDVALLRLVSDSLTAQTIAGTLSLVMLVSESSASLNAVYHVHAYVSQGDTDTVRGTLLTDYIDATEWGTADAQMAVAAQTLSSVAASLDDRIVVEIGYRANNASALSRSGSLRYGGATAADAVAGGSTTGTGWVEFSQDLVFTPTYLYLNNHVAPASAASPGAFQGAWDDTAVAVTRQLSTDRVDSVGEASLARAETNASNAWDVCLFRGISQQLAAQTIAGTLDIGIGFIESSTSADMGLHLHVWVMKPDGTSRGTLLTDYRETTMATDEFSTSQGSGGRRLLTVQTLSSLAVSAGDRIVVEAGYVATNSVTTSFTGTIIYGGSDGTAEVVSGGNVSTATEDVSAYVVFHSGLTFVPPDVRVSQLCAEVVVLPDTQAARVSQFVAEVVVPVVPTGSVGQVTIAT